MQSAGEFLKKAGIGVLAVGALFLLATLVWQGIVAAGVPDPTLGKDVGPAVLNTGLLVFREGLETILVLSTLVAGFTQDRASLTKPVFTGAAVGVFVSLLTWFAFVGVLTDLSKNVSALNLQAATGLVAIIVLLLVMNWFFHSIYWTGWLSLHGRKKKELIKAENAGGSQNKLFFGLVMLGFWSVYREGFELSLFLQSMRLQLGSLVVLEGVAVGMFFTALVGVLTFIGHKKLPYRQMLLITGVLLAGVLLVMVGEEVQEMQLAGWISTTELPLPIPAWAGVWFALFPNVEGLGAQLVAALLVAGSYLVAQYKNVWSKHPNSKWRF